MVKTDRTVSPYISDWDRLSTRDGSKVGSAIQSAFLWDFPGNTGDENLRFSFETAPKAVDDPSGYIYGSIRWQAPA